MSLTLGEFRKLTAHLPDDVRLMYHAWDKGCALSGYVPADVWMYPKGGDVTHAVVINPGSDYDSRASRKAVEKSGRVR